MNFNVNFAHFCSILQKLEGKEEGTYKNLGFNRTGEKEREKLLY